MFIASPFDVSHFFSQFPFWKPKNLLNFQAGDRFEGGVEYQPKPGANQVFRQNGPPPSDYPVEVESNNAMANQPVVDHSWTGAMRKNTDHNHVFLEHKCGFPSLGVPKMNGL